ncbi:MAG TPA: hypothetical protein VHU22_00695 [Xanthobacteraceae bacterium]|jgi:hypothetical protein|nr:hypothetical protein [Xanthobacteraceae bacterium]
MASFDVGGAGAPQDKPAEPSAGAASVAQSAAAQTSSVQGKPGLWQRIKGIVGLAEGEFVFVRGLALVSLLGTLIGAYFQNLSAYQDKVSALAQQDMATATTAFTDTANTLSQAITLQDLLFYDFIHANKLNAGGDDNALTSKHARDLDKPYEETASSLHENVNLIARKMEIYVDWPSNRGRDPATDRSFGADPINMSVLGAVDFDCDEDMPKFDPNDHVVRKTKGGKSLDVDWYSAKHHVYTIAYCFEVTHKAWMETVRQWASQSSLQPDAVANFFSTHTADHLHDRLDGEIVRLNAFMSRAMNEIEAIRVKYRPNGFLCSVPGSREILGQKCMPVRTAEN